MKRVVIIFSIAVVIVLLSLTLSQALSSSAQRNQRKTLDEEALEQSREFFGRMSMKCGDYYYYKYNADQSRLFQCKRAPTVSAEGKTYQARQVSEADRLNGVDPLPIAWQGRAIIHLGLCRAQSYSQRSLPGYNSWEPWLDENNDAVTLTNRKGQWEFYNQPTGREAYTVTVVTPITCNDVPSETRRFTAKPPYWSGEAKNGAGYPIGNKLRIPATYGKWFSLGRGPIKIQLPTVFSQINIDGTDNSINPAGEGSRYGVDLTAPGTARERRTTLRS